MDLDRTFAEPGLAADGTVSLRPLRCTGVGPTRVLLLTSGLGVGHVRAAQAIEAALRDGDVVVRTCDLWSLMNMGVARAIQATYLELVQRHPQLYERIYQLNERTWRDVLEDEAGPPVAVREALELICDIAARAGTTVPRGGRYASDRLLLSLLCTALPYDGDSLAGNGVRARFALLKWTWLRLIRRLEPRIRKFAPDAIVSTQMIPSAMASSLKQHGRLHAPLIGVMTDFGLHDFWKQPGVDCYCLAHARIAERLDAMPGQTRIVATGVPLMPPFAAPLSQPEARRQLGLPEDAPIVLVLGGGLGLSVDTAAARLLESHTEALLIVMSGRNTTAHESLAALAARQPHRRLRVCEWTEHMDLYYRAADLVVSKPGGVTVAEALACGRPLLATRSLGGQEGFNVRFLEEQGVGGLVADSALPGRVAALLADRRTLRQMQQRAWLLGARDGAARVAELTFELAARQRRNMAAGAP